MRKSPALMVALGLAYSGPAWACNCALTMLTPDEAFRATDVFVEGEVLNPDRFRDARGGARGEKVRMRVVKGFKGARPGEVVEYPYEESTCGKTQIPPSGQTVLLHANFANGALSETRCFAQVSWTGTQDGFNDDSAYKAYRQLLEAYPSKREDRLKRARESGNPKERIEIAKSFIEDRDPKSALLVLADMPKDDPAVSELQSTGELLLRVR